MFAYVNQENISVEEMGVETNEVNQGKKPTLEITNIGWNGRTPLIEAAACSHRQSCEYLITEQRAIFETRDDDQKTSLILAASSNHIEVIKVLLQNNANIKAKDNNGDHAAYSAACHGALDALKMLVEKDGDVIDLKGEYGETPLIAASRSRRVDVCKYLAEKKEWKCQFEAQIWKQYSSRYP